MDIKVSVIMPVYNAAAFLHQCLDSVINQTLQEIEIICIDDGSRDDSLAILEAYAKKEPRMQVLRQENAGAGAARNKGLAVAKGAYLSILDADDFFEPDMLEKAYEKAVETRAQIVVFRADRYRMDLDQFDPIPWSICEKALPVYRPMDRYTFTENVFKVFLGWAWDKLFDRSFVEENHLRFQEIRSSNDLLFVFTAICVAARIEIVEDVLLHQRSGNPASISNSREKSWDNCYKALTALREALRERGIFWELEQDYINYALHFIHWHYDTLQGEAKELLLAQLKESYFADLGIKDKAEDYFWNKGEYAKYVALLS